MATTTIGDPSISDGPRYIIELCAFITIPLV
jgi:hypothetical protein